MGRRLRLYKLHSPTGSTPPIWITPVEAIGDELTSNPTVCKLTFTASTGIGWSSAPVRQEFVFGAGRQHAVHCVRRRRYRNAGQTCVCANRILVQDGVYDAFTNRLPETVGAMKVADGLRPGRSVGP